MAVGVNETAIVTTTIHIPTTVFTELARHGTLIVAGDKSTPRETEELVTSLGGVYLPWHEQRDWQCSEKIGWKSIQRRNVAFLEAYRRGYEIIITADDDNMPVNDTWGREHRNRLTEKYSTMTVSTSGWYDPGLACRPQIVARGMPYDDDLRGGTVATRPGDVRYQLGVNEGLWLGDPDIDALQRIVRRPHVTHIDGQSGLRVPQPGTWSPINSQNTAWRRELVPLAAVWPHTGRWDDILGGYVAQWSIYGGDYRIGYGTPLVTQERNDHDLFVDLAKELWGVKLTRWFCEEFLGSLTATGNPLEDITTVADAMVDLDGTEWSAVEYFLRAWVKDWEGMME